jgi:hypothetical protein
MSPGCSRLNWLKCLPRVLGDAWGGGPQRARPLVVVAGGPEGIEEISANQRSTRFSHDP